MALQDLLEQNRKWADGKLASDPDFFQRHVALLEFRDQAFEFGERFFEVGQRIRRRARFVIRLVGFRFHARDVKRRDATGQTIDDPD